MDKLSQQSFEQAQKTAEKRYDNTGFEGCFMGIPVNDEFSKKALLGMLAIMDEYFKYLASLKARE